MGGVNFRDAYEFDPETYGGESRGLLGRLLSLQAEQSQYQPFGGNGGRAASVPPVPDFSQFPSQGTSSPSIPTDAQLKAAYASPDVPLTAQQIEPAAQPLRSFSDRLQAAWDHPHPHGLMRGAKEALNGITGAVQSSIDATRPIFTEEDAFRQNLGREQGPVGAWQGASILSPSTPSGAGGIFASALSGALRNGLPWLPAGARIAGRGIDGPIVAGLEDRFPEAVNWLRNARTGDVPGVLSHAELGDRRVDLIFGTPKYGVNHIDIEHPGELDRLPENWPSMLMKGEGPSRVVMENSDQVRAVIPKVREDQPKNWLLTYYDRKDISDRPGSKSFDSASAQDRAVPFPDRPASPNIIQDSLFLNAPQASGSVVSRTVSSALGGINPLNATNSQEQSVADRPLGIVSNKPMPQWPFPPPIWGARR